MSGVLSLKFPDNPDAWLEALPQYQRTLVDQLLATSQSSEEAASRWLSVSPRDTFPFGTTQGTKPFLDKLWDELEAFLCGDPKYETDRVKLLAQSKPGYAYIVGAISVAIAPSVGSTAVFLAPVIVLLLMTIGKLSLNAWCTVRKEAKKESAT